jgi:sugar phosphate isomerase/epimerase
MDRPARPLGIDHLTFLDLSPPELVSVAAEAGYDAVGVRVHPSTADEEPWPMAPGSPMLAETVRHADALGVRVLAVEVLRLRPDTRRGDYEPALEAGAALGARFATVNGDDPDPSRASDTFAALVADAAPYGVRPLVEPIVYTAVADLDQAVALAQASGGGGVLFDTLHFRRYGGEIETLRGLDPGLLGYAQVCDAPLEPPSGLPRPAALPRGQSTDGTELQLESRWHRLVPGEGELPLADMLAALPDGLPLAVEVPNGPLLEALGALAFARRAREATLALLETVP